MVKNLIAISFLLLLLAPDPASARYSRESAILSSSPAPMIGRNRKVTVHPRETLMDLAYREGVGFQNLVAANPGIDPWLPPGKARIVIPEAAILPAAAGPGITINLAEFRLYYIWEEKGRRRLRVYPIGIGSEGWESPEGNFTIIQKLEKPTWTPPPSIRRERPDEPAFVPPGPDNPLGDYWLGLSARGYGIHGTNKPMGVGRRVSRGCIRLYPDDIRDLYRRVKVGTPVRIIYQPIKLGLQKKSLVLEVHSDFLGQMENPLAEIIRQKRALAWKGPIDLTTLLTILREAKGVPTPLLPHK